MERILEYFKNFPLERLVYIAFLCLFSFLAVKIILICFDKFMKKAKADALVCKILRIFIKIFLISIAVIIVLSSIGVSVSSLVAALSVVGVAFSLAIQGFLSNAFGGIQIISNKPFKIGDYIEVGSDAGLVREVGLFYTKLDTYDKKLIQIPNGKILNETIVNYTNSPRRRIDASVYASYDSDAEKVISVLVDVCKANPLVILEEGFMPFAHVVEYQHSHIAYTVRAWCETKDYWTVYFDVMDNLQAAFIKNGIKFSYPHMNVHMVDSDKAPGETLKE